MFVIFGYFVIYLFFTDIAEVVLGFLLVYLELLVFEYYI